MRKATLTMLAAISLAAISTPVLAQYVYYPRQVYTEVEMPRSSIRTLPYAQAYAACYDLALQRGQNPSRGDNYSRDRFMSDCLAGRIPF